MKPALSHASSAQNSEVAPTFLDNFGTSDYVLLIKHGSSHTLISVI